MKQVKQYVFCLSIAMAFSVGCVPSESFILGKSSGLTDGESPVVPPSPPAPPSIGYGISSQKLFSNEAITPIQPATTSGVGLNYSISPNLPSGLTLDASTGEIQGTPVVTSSLTTYTVTATDSYGQTATAQIALATKPVYIVDTTADLSDVTPGDGVCETAALNCSIRAAVEEANALGLGGKVSIPGGTYVITASQLIVTSEIDLVGASRDGTVLDGVNSRRIIDATGAALTLKNMTITRGNGNDNSNVKHSGAGVRYVNASGELIVENVAFTNNVAVHTGQGYGGGGLYFSGDRATVSNSIFTGNQAYLSGGGSSSGGGGGAELVGRAITVTGSTFSNNISQSFGGGLKINATESATVTDSTISANTNNDFAGWGGGLYFNSQGLNNLIARNLISNNQGYWGAGIRLDWATGGLIENNTFHNNTGISNYSAALYYSNEDGSNHYLLRNNTFSSNTKAIYASVARLRLANNIFFENGGPTGNGACDFMVAEVLSLGGNISDGSSCVSVIPLDAPPGTMFLNVFDLNDLLSTNPLLAAGGPQNNGGQTNSILVQSGSPALGFGVISQCPTVDQRGVARPSGLACTSGATQ